MPRHPEEEIRADVVVTGGWGRELGSDDNLSLEFRLVITDPVSRLMIAEIAIPGSVLIEALAGRQSHNAALCPAGFYGLDRIGFKHQLAEIRWEVGEYNPELVMLRLAEINAAVGVDGWSGPKVGPSNSHNFFKVDGKNWYRETWHRYVPQDAPESDAAINLCHAVSFKVKVDVRTPGV